jgi:SHS family sialic acid transporter-like MFS transporter
MQTPEADIAPTGRELPWYRAIGPECWRVLIAGWAVWALDAIDFLSITFVISDIARQFHVSLSTTSLLLFATYGVRWLGGLLFGSWSDRIGRKIPLLVALTWFTVCAVLTGLAWSFTAIIVFRLLLGFGMAPGFSLGATLIAETWPEKYRSIGIGIHDSGWGVGGIGAALIYGLVYPYTGWRGIFFVGVVPAILLGLFIAFFVDESAVWKSGAARRAAGGTPAIMLFRQYPKRVAFLAVLMADARPVPELPEVAELPHLGHRHVDGDRRDRTGGRLHLLGLHSGTFRAEKRPQLDACWRCCRCDRPHSRHP